MKYLKVFETDTDQQNYINGEFDRPNITIVRHKKQSINYVPNIPEVSGPITFSIQDHDGLITYYTIPYQMTWEEFINSDLNETKIDSRGNYYKQFEFKNDIPAYAFLYEGELDHYYEIYILGIGYIEKTKNIESVIYLAD